MEAEGTKRKQLMSRKPVLVNKIESCHDYINMAILVPNNDVVISVSDDKTLRVWQKRDSGQYWPSIYHTLPSEPTCIDFSIETKRVFVGMDSGCISEYIMADDFNRITHKKDFIAHQGQATQVRFSLACEWVLSCGKDRYFQWHCSESGHRLGAFLNQSSCLCMESSLIMSHGEATCYYLVWILSDKIRGYAFIGDYSGQVSVLKLKDDAFDHITTLKGHSGSILCLGWDVDRKLLFSGSFDESIIVWDIGGKKGTAFELQGHRDKVQGLVYVQSTKQLISTSSDCVLTVWDMNAQRVETPEWLDGNSCHSCDTPFFWNWRKMWGEKTIGNRQHHCRLCGNAFCSKCCCRRSTMPAMGFEYEVRVCDQCYGRITEQDRFPLATFHDVRHNVLHMDFDVTRSLLLTTGNDRVMKLWDLSGVVQ